MSGPVSLQWGDVEFRGIAVPITLVAQTTNAVRVGTEAQREGREGVVPFRIDDLSGGLLPTAGIMSWARDKNRVYFNEGLIAHIPGYLGLPYKLTTNAALKALDVSGYRAANKRVHAIVSSLGATGLRWYAFIGPNAYKDTSLTDPALVLPATADNITDNVTAVAKLQMNSVNYLVIATDSTTDDIKGTADPTADSITWVSLVTLAGGDYVNGMAAMPHLGPGINVFVGKIGGVSGVWYGKQTVAVPQTLIPAVLSSSATQEGTAATVTLGPQSPTVGSQVWGSGEGVDRWSNPENILSSNDVWATWNPTAITDVTNYLVASGFDFSTIPLAALITGILVEIEAGENTNTDNMHIGTVQLLVGGSVVGLDRGTDDELPNGVGFDDYFSFGSSTDRWGVQLTGADMQQFAVQCQLRMLETAGSSDSGRVDHIRVTVTYRMPGVSPVPALGGFTCGVLPSNPSRLPVVEPDRDDPTAVTVPRRLKFYDFLWDPTGDRALVDVAFPNTGLAYTGVMKPFQGGLAVAGGSNSMVWDTVKLLDANDQTRDLGFPSVHGTNALTITAMEAKGPVLIVDTAYTDGSEAQRWMYYNGRWHASWVQQDKSSAISTEPILWAESSLNLQQNFAYRFFPVSNTAIAGAREFVPSDLFADPRLVNTSQVRQDGPLYAQLVELDVGPEEMDKALMTLQVQSRQIDNNTSFGSVRVKIDTGGDRTIASAEIDETFDAAAECFIDRNLVTTHNPGIAYRSQIIRLILDHEAASAESPNPLPILEQFTAQWPFLERFAVLLSLSGQRVAPKDLYEQFKTLKATKLVQRFLGDGYDCPAVIDDVQIDWEPTVGQIGPAWSQVKKFVIVVRRVVGATS